ncbi:hypothetical protein [uncultured Gammaproteobacteria bacterium]|nr:hypothetical protein [uncultured Gammaproteobacteria bacterium]
MITMMTGTIRVNVSHVQNNYKITGTVNSNGSLSKGGLVDGFTTLKPKNWKQEKTIYDEGSHNFNDGRYLKLENRSNALSFDPFTYIAKGYPLEVDGSLGSTISGLNWVITHLAMDLWEVLELLILVFIINMTPIG